MKLSEAIRAGAKIGPQARGHLSRVRRKWFFGLIGPKVKELCAMGGAHEAQGCTVSWMKTVGGTTTGFRGEPKAVEGERYVRVVQEPDEWNDVQWSYVYCPQCDYEDYVYRMVPHLNDVHRWTREEIAVFVERVECNPTVITLHEGDGSSEHPYQDKLAHGSLDDRSSQTLYARLHAAPRIRQMFPGYGSCGRCQFPWAIVEGHLTSYQEGRGCFPLCEQCWKELKTPDARMPYYMALVDSWESDGRDDCTATRQAIVNAVLSEGQPEIEWPSVIGDPAQSGFGL